MTISDSTIDERIAALPWTELGATLDERGFVQTPRLLSADECSDLDALYGSAAFRSTVTMSQHGFGRGEYKYFDHPLPDIVVALREAFYPRLAATANRWAAWLGEEASYPDVLESFLERCHRAGQMRPTPLMLRYSPGDWNALHRDLYGDVVFPFQVVILLDRPGVDFVGGELVLLEQRPRAQSRAHVVTLEQGAALIFTTRERPARGARGFYRAAVRHGVSTLVGGKRTTLGVIFHDAS